MRAGNAASRSTRRLDPTMARNVWRGALALLGSAPVRTVRKIRVAHDSSTEIGGREARLLQMSIDQDRME